MSRVGINPLQIGGALLITVAMGTASEAATTTRVASGLTYAVYVTAPAGDDRLFIVEQRGLIKILKNGAVLGTPFLDIDALVPNISGNDERGLLGLAFHPDYANNGYFYIDYTDTVTGNTKIVRYSRSAGNPDQADATSALLLFNIADPYSNHNGGCLQFGADGMLYIGLGDGGSGGDPENRSQNPAELWGKMLRIDVDNGLPYSIPADNPFVGQPGYREEIWDLGVRNPWRFSFDRSTHDLWIGDVGQNAWEEIDFEPAGEGGKNYGWRLTEGNHCYNPPSNCDDGNPVITYPVYEYSHGTGCSVTGGYVYRGSVTNLDGHYFFADFCTPSIWSFKLVGGVVTEFTNRTTELAPGGGMTIGTISSFGEDGFGELYIVDRGAVGTGEVYKIVPNPNAVSPGQPKGTGLLLGPAVPNPSSGSMQFRLALDQPGRVEVTVVAPTGRLVRHLLSSMEIRGARALTWDGLDDTGRRAPGGVYFVRASANGQAATQRVQLLR